MTQSFTALERAPWPFALTVRYFDYIIISKINIMNLLIMIKNFHNVRPIKTTLCLQTSDFPKKTLKTAVKRTSANLAFNVLTVARTTRPSLVT